MQVNDCWRGVKSLKCGSSPSKVLRKMWRGKAFGDVKYPTRRFAYSSPRTDRILPHVERYASLGEYGKAFTAWDIVGILGGGGGDLQFNNMATECWLLIEMGQLHTEKRGFCTGVDHSFLKLWKCIWARNLPSMCLPEMLEETRTKYCTFYFCFHWEILLLRSTQARLRSFPFFGFIGHASCNLLPGLTLRFWSEYTRTRRIVTCKTSNTVTVIETSEIIL